MMQQEQSEMNLMDILLLAWRYWYVYVIVLVLCLGGAVYYLKKTPPQYQRVATVLIKDKDSKAPSEAQVFQEVGFLNVSANVENELLIFKSQRLAEDVVRRLNLEVSYKKQSGLRQVDLYGISPVQVVFPEGERLACTLKVGLKSSKEVTLSDFRYQGELLGQEMTVRLNDTVQTPVGRLVVKPTEFLTKEVLGEEIDVLKGTLEGVALAYSNAVMASKASKEATMIQLSLTDESPRRAEDVLNTLVTAYKEDMIRDKNTVTQNTERFIAERLQILEQELGGVDSKIAEYKSANQMTDLASQTGLYLANADKYQNEAVTLQNEKMLTQYLKQYVQDPTKDKELIPANTGVNDQNLERQIAEYNKLRLQLDKLSQGTTGENPVVLDMQQTMRSLRESIVRTLDNNLQALNLRIGSLQRQEARSTQKVASMPTQQKFVLSVERQQKVKEQLYVYLLQKREENALAACSAGKWGFINSMFSIAVPPTYQEVGDFSENVAPAELNGKWGVIDKQGKVLVPFQYDEIKPCRENALAVCSAGEWGFIRPSGELLIDFQYKKACSFSEGTAAVSPDGESYIYIDSTGNQVIPGEYQQAGMFHDGVAAIRKNDAFGAIDKTGREIIPAVYAYISDFSDGLAVCSVNSRFGYINTRGELIIPLSYAEASPFENGIARVWERIKVTETSINGSRVIQEIPVGGGYIDMKNRKFYDCD